ncbi:MAG: tetratricopeptide repeat protein [Paludibacteraceae bacterium]
MKKGMILTVFVALFTVLSASNKTAIDYYESGDWKKAKSLFLTTNNLDALDYYYLGMINLKDNNKNAASEAFHKGLQADPANLYNSVGLAAIQIATDPKGADKALKTISNNKLYKKDTKMQVAIAEAYALNNNLVQTNTYLAKAKKADKKSALPYIFEGNQLMAQGKTNEAAVSFENAVYFDPNSKIALVKLAQLYVGTRKQIAFDYLDKATTIDPNYEYGWKTQADLRYKNGFYPEAKNAFEKYMSLIKPQPDDYQTYGEILYFNKDYAGSLSALSNSPVNTVTNRLKMYNLHDQGKFDEAIPVAQTLINTTNKSELIYQDYSYFAEMLNKTKDYANAAKYYELAYQTDSTHKGAVTDIARAYDNAKNYPKAIEYYKKVLDSNPAYTMADIYSLGAAYYSAGTDAVTTPDVSERNEYLKKASDTFGKMAQEFPDHYLGYLSQARSNSALDPETKQGLAKPYYEKALAIMLPNQSERKNDIMEVYQYMGIYYLKKDDYPQSRSYWVKVLELDPTNAIAQQVIKSIDSVKKK